MICLVAALPAHVGRVANRMREIDRRECGAFGHSPKAALRSGLRASSFAITALVDGEPHAMMGVAPLNAIEGAGRPWMLGSEHVTLCARQLLTLGAPIISEMHRRFRRLENVVSADNRRAIRLLERWGFQLGDETMDVGGIAFVPFWREGDV